MNTSNVQLPAPFARPAQQPLVSSGRPLADAGATPGARPSARVVRISRQPEEAALFAYNRQAQIAQTGGEPPQVNKRIDVFV